MLTFLKTIPFCFCLFLSTSVFSQSPDDLQKALAKIDSLEKALDEGNYTRVPNRDFDEKLNAKVITEVNDRISILESSLATIGAVVGLILAIVTAIGGFAIRGLVKETVQNEVEKESVRLKNSFEDDINKIVHNVKINLENKLKEVEHELEVNREFTNYTKRFIYEDELNKLKQQLDRNPNSDLLKSNLKNLLLKAEEIDYGELVTQIIDELVYVNFKMRKDDENFEILENYAQKYKIKERTYINASLGQIDYYRNYGDVNKRELAVKYLEKSLELIPGYGESMGLLLGIYMIDFEKTDDEASRQEIMENTLKLVKQINSSPTGTSAWETISRLNRDKNNTSYGKYVKMLYNMFPEEMKAMEEKAKYLPEQLKKSPAYTPEMSKLVDQYLKTDEENEG
ncbi:hypothetical protein [Flexithrix dorotheae]|uniref:hypothetical protein n=1 Tax=Flexithrix dorotheae TaxID=70993 RepID=UPI00036753F2|nr:hypothetical protein [Flexithrix dorotheae]